MQGSSLGKNIKNDLCQSSSLNACVCLFKVLNVIGSHLVGSGLGLDHNKSDRIRFGSGSDVGSDRIGLDPIRPNRLIDRSINRRFA